MEVIDIHTHMMGSTWVDAITSHKRYGSAEFNGKKMIALGGKPYIPIEDEMLDYEKRIKDMDAAGVDLAIVSLTTPSVYWADKELAVKLSVSINDEMAEQQRIYPDRLRFFATLPWQFPDEAILELDRALMAGAVGIFVGANIEGASLTDPLFETVWRRIDEKSLPVLVHPGPLPVDAEMNLSQYNLMQSVGFMCDTTISISRMIFDGFFDRYQGLKIIVSHVGGTLPYIVGRLDACYEFMAPCRENINQKPSEYLRMMYYDSLGFTPDAIRLCLEVGGSEHVMYGSDYPHLIGQMDLAKERVNKLPSKFHKSIFNNAARTIFSL